MGGQRERNQHKICKWHSERSEIYGHQIWNLISWYKKLKVTSIIVTKIQRNKDPQTVMHGL